MPRTSRTNTPVERGQQSNRYDPIPEGTYYGVIRKLKFETFTTNAGYDMDKFTPLVVLFNTNGTHIDRQNLTIGALSADGEYTAEYFNSDNASVIFAGYKMAEGNFGARNLMFTLAMLNGDGYVNFNEDAIVDVIVKVRVKSRAYTWNNSPRHENVIIRWDTVTAEDYEALAELGIETNEWVTNNVCVLEGEGDRIAEFSRMVFETQAAYELWHDLFINGTDEWQNEVGELGEDTGEVGMENWDDWTGLFAEAEEEIEAEEEDDRSDYDIAKQAELEKLPENQNPDSESDDSEATVADLPM